MNNNNNASSVIFRQVKTVASIQNAILFPRPLNKQNPSELKRREHCHKMKLSKT